jgi:elongation factor G
VSKLDMPRSDYDDTIARCQRAFGDARRSTSRSRRRQGVVGSMGLLSQRVFDSSSGSASSATPLLTRPLPSRSGAVRSSRRSSRSPRTTPSSTGYLEGEDISTETVIEDLKTAVAKATFFPLVPISPATGVGPRRGLEVIEQCFPSPATRPAPTAYSPGRADAPAAQL